jgi:hypothetical protein
MGFLILKKNKNKPVWHYKWKAPYRQADGSLVYAWTQKSCGTDNKKLAGKAADRLKQEAAEASTRLEAASTLTFAEACILYMDSGKFSEYLCPLIDELGIMPVTEIDQDVILKLCRKIKPDCAPSTLNRHVFTPVLAVINFCARLRKCPPPALQRPSGHDKAPTLEIPDERWFELTLKHAVPKTRLAILLLTLHGLRVSEAIERTPGEVNVSDWTLSIPDTKNGRPVLVRLSPPVIDAIKAIPAWRKQRWLCGSCHRSNLAKSIKAAVKRAEAELQMTDPDAKLSTFGTHALGRHSFASRLLKEGFSLKFVQDAGRWATGKMVSDRYGHLEQSEVASAVNEAAAIWARKSAGGGILPLRIASSN